MQAEPQDEHRWLQQLVGDWSYETEAMMGPDQPPMKMTGTERVRAIGGFWIQGESTGAMGCDDAGEATMLITVGYDPAKGCFVGTWLGSMMSNLWIYEGQLDAERKVLTLEAEGASFADPAVRTRYQDIVELASPDLRLFRSRMLLPDGSWQEFVTGTHRRIGR